jgi:hypothetical protein
MRAVTDPAGLARWRTKVLQRFPAAVHENIKAANQQNATEFKDQVLAGIAHGDGTLEATVKLEPVGEVGFKVSVGGPEAPYPLHLDAGHMTPAGVHVPAKPFWYVARRLLRKRFRARAARARTKAIHAVAATGGSA